MFIADLNPLNGARRGERIDILIVNRPSLKIKFSLVNGSMALCHGDAFTYISDLTLSSFRWGTSVRLYTCGTFTYYLSSFRWFTAVWHLAVPPLTICPPLGGVHLSDCTPGGTFTYYMSSFRWFTAVRHLAVPSLTICPPLGGVHLSDCTPGGTFTYYLRLNSILALDKLNGDVCQENNYYIFFIIFVWIFIIEKCQFNRRTFCSATSYQSYFIPNKNTTDHNNHIFLIN